MADAPSALTGLTILDFSRVLAGPFATMVPADLGATGTKVECPGRGDDTRAWGPPYDAAGQATYFHAADRNKASIVLDLRDRSIRRLRGPRRWKSLSWSTTSGVG